MSYTKVIIKSADDLGPEDKIQKELKSILIDLETGEIDKYTAYSLLISLFNIPPPDSKEEEKKVRCSNCGKLIGNCDASCFYKSVEQPDKAEEILKEYADLACNIALDDLKDEVYCVTVEEAIKAMHDFAASERRKERFKRPTDKQTVEIAILFNNGKMQKAKLADMIAMADFMIDRLYENGDVTKKSSKE